MRARPRSGIRRARRLEISAIADAVFSARIFGDIEAGYPAGAWTPSFRLALGTSLDVERQAIVGRATLRVTQASLEVCPIRATITSFSAMRPCAGVSAGVLDAQGEGVANAHRTSRPWVAASAYVRLEWTPLHSLAFELDAGAIAPIYRDSFYFSHDPNVSVYRAPPVAFTARVGLRVRFP